MNGGIIGKSNFPSQKGVYTPDDYICRKDLRYTPLWNPTSTSGLSAVNGEISYYSDVGLFGGSISLTKTSTAYFNPHFYGSIGGTHNLDLATFVVNVYFSPYFLSVARQTGTVFTFALGTGTSAHRDVYLPLSAISEGWNQFRFRGADFTVGTIANLGAVTWLMFMFYVEAKTTTFGHGNLYVDAVLCRKI